MAAMPATITKEPKEPNANRFDQWQALLDPAKLV